jgi:phosphoglucomutase
MAIAGKLDPHVYARIQQWLNGAYDAATKAEIEKMVLADDITGLTDAFYTDLEFGTGGIRGIMGAGSNRVNRYTFGAAAQGFANYFLKQYPGQEIALAVTHDCRNNGKELAKTVVDIFTANGIKVYFFESLRPTPELSFAIRHLGCKGGVMLTASHNPKEYNGFKAYGHDGGQLVEPHDVMVMDEVQRITDISAIRFEGNDTLITYVGNEIDKAYIEALLKVSLAQEAIRRQKDMKIVYSPIHGTGGMIVPETLARWGFEQVHCVAPQMVVDGNFPTVIYPNPEEKEAMTLAISTARDIDAEIVLATDPDADRVGMAIRDDQGEFILLNGNQAVSLLVHYVIESWSRAGKLTDDHYVVKTIVTSNLIDKIASSYGVTCYNTLTGFKYVGEMMTKLQGQKFYLAGGEESYGYLVGEHARDKDAVVSCAMLSEMAAYYKDQGSSVYDALLAIYQKYGYYREKLISITKHGKAGADEIKAMMERYRSNTPTVLGGNKVVILKDYKSSTATYLESGKTESIDLPKSNVLQFVTEDGSVISARPSGTEPKIKFYCSIIGQLDDPKDFKQVSQALDDRLDTIMSDLGL